MPKILIIAIISAVLFQLSAIEQIQLSPNLESRISDLSVSADSLYRLLANWKEYPKPEKTGEFLLAYNSINDTLQAPYVIYIPTGYDALQATPLYLHGGVSRPEFIEDPLDMAAGNSFVPYAEKENWFMLFPFANQDCCWWDESGMENIQQQILLLKGRFNLDDDRVYITGFSDGASGCFHLALNRPSLFASFYPLNGMLTVGHAVTGLPVYVRNLSNRYLRVINTDLDGLYPAAVMKKLLQFTLQNKANLLYKEYWGIGHDFQYAAREIPAIIADMKNHPRQSSAPVISWETSFPQTGRCDWLEILEIDTLENVQSWHTQPNITLEDNRLQFGFYDDRNFTGSGTRIEKIVPGSVAEDMGLQSGDIIRGMDGIPVNSIDSLLTLRDSRKRGDDFSLTVLRNEKTIELEGRFPETVFYEAFNYPLSSAAIRASYWANEFHIETSRIRSFRIYLHPDMINPAIPVKIFVNEVLHFADRIDFDRDFIREEFLQNLDRKALFYNYIEIGI